jgi:hypothetical protein
MLRLIVVDFKTLAPYEYGVAWWPANKPNISTKYN